MKNHRKIWTTKEEDHLFSLIVKNSPIDEMITQLKRTESSVKTKANHLGFGHYYDKEDETTYFVNNINHKNRRTKKEILANQMDDPFGMMIPIEDCVKKSTSIIADESKADNELNILQELNKLEVMFSEGIHAIKTLKEAL